MFNFVSILLLLTAVLQIVVAIELRVKPSNLRYTAEISCDNSDGPITIGRAKHDSIFGEWGTTGYVDIRIDLSRCDDHHNSTVKVRITNLYHPNESMEFEISKAELSARKSAVVLGFNTPSAHKIFYFQQSSTNFGVSQRPLVDYELEIDCNYIHANRLTQYYLIGSGVQLNGQNGINIPIYETGMLASCRENRIELNIYKAGRERPTYINVTREFLLQNDAFNIDIVNKTVRPISQGRTENVLSRTIESLSTIPSGASSSTTGQIESSTIATTHDEASTSSQAAKTESEVDEMESKQQSENNESVSGKNICTICQHRLREIAFVPCGHLCACLECSKKIMISNKNECPICRKRIENPLKIFIP